MLVLLPLTRGKVTIIDESDEALIKGYRWFATPGGGELWYAKNHRVGVLHRLIMDAPDGLEVDHINGDGLDNRRSNLRLVTHQQQMCNMRIRGGTSQYKGVHWSTAEKKWKAQICVDYAKHYLGWFHTEIEAALAYDEAARKLHGTHARTNFPQVRRIADSGT